MTEKAMKKGRLYETSVRGQLIRKMLLASNETSMKFSKLSIDIALYLISRGRTKPFDSMFYPDLQSLAQKVADYSGRDSVPTKGAMSTALKNITNAGLYEYSIDLPTKREKHGDKKGIRLTLIR